MGGFETKRKIDVLRGNLSLDVAPYAVLKSYIQKIENNILRPP